MSTLRFENFIGHWQKKGSKVRVPNRGEISLSVDTGEWVFVTGKNGTGKSTFFNAICGFADHVVGNIYIDEQLIDPRDVRSCFHAGFQYVPQHSNYCASNLFWNDAIDLMRLNRQGLYNSKAISDLYAHLSIAGLIKDDTPIHPRVFDLIIALSSVPSVLILDEISFPMFNSKEETLNMYRIIRKLAPMATVLFSEHDLQIGANVANSIIWLADDKEPDVFDTQDKEALKRLLTLNSGPKEDLLARGDFTTLTWEKAVEPGITPHEHINFIIRFCTENYYKAKAIKIHFDNNHNLRSKIHLDFPFLSESKKNAGFLSGGQKIVLAWFLLDFTGIGSVPKSAFKHLDDSNKSKIKQFWSKVRVKKATLV